MPLLEAIALAARAIWGARLRSFFTLLGIIVSVAFLVMVVAVIQGMNAYVRETLTGAILGTNAFQVRRTPIVIGLLDDEEIKRIARRPRITRDDADVVREALPDAQAVALDERLRAENPWPPVTGSVDVVGDRQLPALAWGLDYRPRPVFQSVAVMNAALAGINLALD